jgi:hypothetical protein
MRNSGYLLLLPGWEEYLVLLSWSSSFIVKEREEGKGKGMLMEGRREERRRKENSMLNI